MAALLAILVGFAFAAYLLYYYMTRDFDYWKKQNVMGPAPIAFFGNFLEVARGKIHLADYFKALYEAYPDEPAIGLFERSKPILMLKDAELISDVLIKHFGTFPNRIENIHPDIDPLSQHLVYLDHERWKPMRKYLTPTFSPAKMKHFFHLIDQCAQHFVHYTASTVAKNDVIEVREHAARFTTDVIGVCAFGLNVNSMVDEDSEFRRYGRAWFGNNWFTFFRRGVRLLPYWAARPFKAIARNDNLINFFVNTIADTMQHRKNNHINRHDFVDALLHLKDNPSLIDGLELTDMLLTAQAFAFFLAGSESSSTAISHAMYELACNPDIQDKLRREISTTLDKNNGQLTFDSIETDMKYLDKVFKETLRKYPSAYDLVRKAENDHTFSKYNITVRKGTWMFVPVYSIHHNPHIYPNPEKFDPERFDAEVAASRPRMSYLPFGDGPRNCLGERFGRIQTKLALISLLKNFHIDKCDKTFKVYKKRANTVVLSPADGVYLKLTKC